MKKIAAVLALTATMLPLAAGAALAGHNDRDRHDWGDRGGWGEHNRDHDDWRYPRNYHYWHRSHHFHPHYRPLPPSTVVYYGTRGGPIVVAPPAPAFQFYGYSYR